MDPNKKKKLKKILFEIFGVGFGIWPKSRKKLIVVLAAILIVISGLIIGGTVVYHSYQNLMGTEGPPLGTGDPGNIRLNRLAADPIFHTLPPGCHQDGKLQKTPARWRPFYHTWDGPAVTKDFICPDQSETEIADLINNIAIRSGWDLQGYNRNIQDLWQKQLEGTIAECLSLSVTGKNLLNTSLPSPSWELSGCTDAINK